MLLNPTYPTHYHFNTYTTKKLFLRYFTFFSSCTVFIIWCVLFRCGISPCGPATLQVLPDHTGLAAAESGSMVFKPAGQSCVPSLPIFFVFPKDVGVPWMLNRDSSRPSRGSVAGVVEAVEAQTEGWQWADSVTISSVLVALWVSHGGGREAGRPGGRAALF